MIHYSISQWCSYWLVIEIDETQENVTAEIVYGGDADTTYEDCEDWIHQQYEAA